MATEAPPRCTCGTCTKCRTALADLVVDGLDAAGEARERGDLVGAESALQDVARLRRKLAAGGPMKVWR